MSAFLKSIDRRTWKAILKGWEHPVALDADGNRTAVLKSEEEWTAIEDKQALGDSKALNALFNDVDKNMFRLIKQCTMAKDAWEILKQHMMAQLRYKVQNFNFLLQNLRN